MMGLWVYGYLFNNEFHFSFPLNVKRPVIIHNSFFVIILLRLNWIFYKSNLDGL